jgi:hypothetical protein
VFLPVNQSDIFVGQSVLVNLILHAIERFHAQAIQAEPLATIFTFHQICVDHQSG